jgi:hypothetical protein
MNFRPSLGGALQLSGGVAPFELSAKPVRVPGRPQLDAGPARLEGGAAG